jgi:histone acetyltransferase (RNA polymerase elongator complex component)
MIIPFFISHQGCPHQCVFCNQNHITGKKAPADAAAIHKTITQFLKTAENNEPADVAFYGGSFTAMQLSVQKNYLEAVKPFIDTEKVQNIRISTRPDAIDCQVLTQLKEHHVQTVELGVQSMQNSVLHRSGRGHTAMDTRKAVKLLRAYGFCIGIQLMLGLPGDSTDTFMSTVRAVVRLKPDFVRLYPLLVLKDTPLERLYKTKQYTPLSLDTAVLLCRNAFVLFEQTGIEVARMGLQPDQELLKPGVIMAGPYHPAFRQLVESSILLDKMRAMLRTEIGKQGSVTFAVLPEDLSAAIGQRRSNIEKLKKEFNLYSVRIVKQNDHVAKREPLLLWAV